MAQRQWGLRIAALLAVLSLLAGGCGTRRSHDELLEAAQVAEPSDRPRSGDGDGDATATSTTLAGATDGPALGTDGSAAPGDPTDPAAPTDPGRRCTGDEPPLVIASVGQLSGPAGNGVADEVKVTQAWVAAKNAQGGVNCHRIEYFVADDGGDPARNQALVRQMVEQRNAVAMVTPTAALTGRASSAYLTQQRIPVIGGVTGEWAFQSPMYFPHGAGGPPGQRTAALATAEFGRLHGVSKLAVVTCAESSDCASVNQEYANHSRAAGIDLVYNGQASALQPDYTSVCQAAQRAGAEMFAPVIGPAGLTRLAQSCARVNFRPLYIVPQVTGQPAMASDTNLTPLGVTLPVVPWTETDIPGIAELHRVLERHAPAVEAGPAAVIGWVSAKLFEEATKDLTEPTSEAILEGLWRIRGNDLGGLTIPLTFTEGRNATPTECWWLVEGDDGRWRSPNQGERHCA